MLSHIVTESDKRHCSPSGRSSQKRHMLFKWRHVGTTCGRRVIAIPWITWALVLGISADLFVPNVLRVLSSTARLLIIVIVFIRLVSFLTICQKRASNSSSFQETISRSNWFQSAWNFIVFLCVHKVCSVESQFLQYMPWFESKSQAFFWFTTKHLRSKLMTSVHIQPIGAFFCGMYCR